MSRVVDKATKLVTTNEEFTGSVEGVECVLLEAMYHNYAGNLHRAWMATRRATTAAQMMMLHRGLKSTSLKFIDPETRTNFNPETLCLRLVEMDCYLSLMLGLPPASLDSTFASPRALEKCDPIERMQRIHCAVSVQILQQNDADVISIDKIYEIDKKLQKAAAEVPPDSWLVPDFALGKDDNSALCRDTTRLMDQFTHYHLLIRLHLPYVLRSSSDSRYDHSKIIAVNASREILARYIVFRTSNPAQFYCRGTDFLAFIAITVICLAHIDSHGRELRHTTEANPILAFNFLAHSRPGDCGVMERTFEIVESMASSGTDSIASKLGYIIRHLLIVESSAAYGTLYMTSSSKGDEEDPECHVKVTEEGQVLRVHIPYFGTISFEGGSISKTSSMAPKHASAGVPREAALPQSQSVVNEASFLHSSSAEVEIEGLQDDWDLGIDIAFFDSLFRGAEIPGPADGEAWEQWAMDDLKNSL